MCCRCILFILSCIFFMSCRNNPFSKEKERISDIVSKMQGKFISFPLEMLNNVIMDSLLSKEFKLVAYIDSAKCMECNLALDEWSVKIREMRKVNEEVSFLFIINSNNYSVIKSLLNKHRFDYPVFIDTTNSFYNLNSLNKDSKFQFFLLDRDNKIILVGNPIRNNSIWMLYKKELGRANNTQPEMSLSSTMLDLGEFSYKVPQFRSFFLRNIGKKTLVIDSTLTSCDCTTVSYDEETVQPGQKLELKVCYKAEQRGYFERMITVYCNVKESPIILYVSGNAK